MILTVARLLSCLWFRSVIRALRSTWDNTVIGRSSHNKLVPFGRTHVVTHHTVQNAWDVDHKLFSLTFNQLNSYSAPGLNGWGLYSEGGGHNNTWAIPEQLETLSLVYDLHDWYYIGQCKRQEEAQRSPAVDWCKVARTRPSKPLRQKAV